MKSNSVSNKRERENVKADERVDETHTLTQLTISKFGKKKN